MGRWVAVGMLLAAVAGCRASESETTAAGASPAMGAARAFVEDAELWVEFEDGSRQRLATDGQDYETHTSPDGVWLVYDVRVLTQLQVTRAASRDPFSGRFGAPVNLSSQAWGIALRSRSAAIEDVESAGTQFVAWGNDAGTVVLDIWGVLPGGTTIQENVIVALGR